MKLEDIHSEIQFRYQRFHRAMLSGSKAEAAYEFQRLLKWLQEKDISNLKSENFSWFYLFWLEIMWRCGMEHKMVDVMDQYLDQFPDDEQTKVWRATILFHTGFIVEAEKEFRSFLEQDIPDPRIFFYLAGIAERNEDYETASNYYLQAYELDNEFTPPTDLDEEEIKSIFDNNLSSLPHELQTAIQLMDIKIKDFPSDNLVQSLNPPLDPWTLGYFWGPEYQKEEITEQKQIPTIQLFAKNISRRAVRMEELNRELQTTLIFEIGSYLGMPESEFQFSPDSEEEEPNEENKN